VKEILDELLVPAVKLGGAGVALPHDVTGPLDGQRSGPSVPENVHGSTFVRTNGGPYEDETVT
jgi:hypothetical protein